METNDFIISGMQLKRLIEKKLEPVMEEYNLRLVELDILVLLHREKEIDTAKKIVQKKHFSKAHISKSIDHLCAGRFIELCEDDADHRILHISLTDRSREVVEKIIRIYKECKEIMQQGISKEEIEILKRTVEKMNANISRELGENA